MEFYGGEEWKKGGMLVCARVQYVSVDIDMDVQIHQDSVLSTA